MTTTWQVFATTGVDEICGRAELVNQYKSLFVSGFKDVSDADKEFITTFGESDSSLNPQSAQIFEDAAAASRKSAPDMAPRRDICKDQTTANAVTLDSYAHHIMLLQRDGKRVWNRIK